MQEQASFAVTVKARATTARAAKNSFFIFIFSVEVSLKPSANNGRRPARWRAQARGGGTGGRVVRSAANSSESVSEQQTPDEGGQTRVTAGSDAFVCAGIKHEAAHSQAAAGLFLPAWSAGWRQQSMAQICTATASAGVRAGATGARTKPMVMKRSARRFITRKITADRRESNGGSFLKQGKARRSGREAAREKAA